MSREPYRFKIKHSDLVLTIVVFHCFHWSALTDYFVCVLMKCSLISETYYTYVFNTRSLRRFVHYAKSPVTSNGVDIQHKAVNEQISCHAVSLTHGMMNELNFPVNDNGI